jgi:hypothetical protein
LRERDVPSRGQKLPSCREFDDAFLTVPRRRHIDRKATLDCRIDLQKFLEGFAVAQPGLLLENASPHRHSTFTTS